MFFTLIKKINIITSVSQGIKVDLDFASGRWSIEKGLNMFDWSSTEVEL